MGYNNLIRRRMFELIYECSVNRVAARKLIDRITAKVTGVSSQ